MLKKGRIIFNKDKSESAFFFRYNFVMFLFLWRKKRKTRNSFSRSLLVSNPHIRSSKALPRKADKQWVTISCSVL